MYANICKCMQTATAEKEKPSSIPTKESNTLCTKLRLRTKQD